MTKAKGTPLADIGGDDVLEDQSVVPNPQTAVRQSFENKTVEIRYGTFEGRQYGWARVLSLDVSCGCG
jgi:hypothetical protein